MSPQIISFILEYNSYLLFLHIAGSIIALGSVFMGDLMGLWIKFKPKKAEIFAKIAPLLSLQIWIGLFLISFSGLLMVLARPGIENYSIFQIKMILVLILFLNGVFLNLYITPKFKSLVPEWQDNTPKVKKFTKIAGLTTIISFICWWGVIILIKIIK